MSTLNNKTLKKNYPLKNLTTFRIGGPAKYYFVANTSDELIQAISWAKSQNIAFLVIGSGSNLLISDNGFAGLIIKNQVAGIQLHDDTLLVSSGTILQDLIDFSIDRGLPGLQKLTGIPGTVGGAIFGNAGAYGQTISDYLIEIVCFNPQTKDTTRINKTSAGFAYRDSSFKRNGLVILQAKFSLPKESPEIIRKEAAGILRERLKKYPPDLKCPGSFFKNILTENLSKVVLNQIPPEKIVFSKIPAGYLLDCVGLKGTRVGNIQISADHANLFINLENGKAQDCLSLAKSCFQKVKERYQIELEPEVQLIGLPKVNG